MAIETILRIDLKDVRLSIECGKCGSVIALKTRRSRCPECDHSWLLDLPDARTKAVEGLVNGFAYLAKQKPADQPFKIRVEVFAP